MKDYIFILDYDMEPQEIIIEATGMMDAIRKVKDFQRQKELGSQAKILFKGIVY